MISVRHALLITSEHGGNLVPPEYQALFQDAEAVLESHRGWDPGSLELAQNLSQATGAELIFTEWTRLLVEVNRSTRHRRLFSEFTASLDPAAKEQLISRYYAPHRQLVSTAVARRVANGSPVLHVGVHTFTPELAGVTRKADVGLLYDPARREEQAFCLLWGEQLKRLAPALRVRRNYPYLGKADGLVTDLRKRFSAKDYLAVELEVNQAFPLGPAADWQAVQNELTNSLIAACEQFRF